MRADPRPRHDQGSTTVEIAVITPVVMLLLMLVVQAGLYHHTRAVAMTAAHKGADATRVENGTVTAGDNATRQFLDRNARGLEQREIAVRRGAAQVDVTVSGNVTSLLFGIDLPVEVTAQAPVEQVTP